jgi:hypothetical protein
MKRAAVMILVAARASLPLRRGEGERRFRSQHAQRQREERAERGRPFSRRREPFQPAAHGCCCGERADRRAARGDRAHLMIDVAATVV